MNIYDYVNPCDKELYNTDAPYTGTQTRVADGAKTVKSYSYTTKNGFENLKSIEYSDGMTVLRKSEYSYNSNKPPQITKIITTDYGSANSVSIQEFAYDGYRSITSQSAYVSGTTSHPTTYTYGTDEDNPHHIPLTVTYQRDASNTIVQTNTLTEDKKKIASTLVTENGVVKSRTEYTYDNYGDIASETNWIEDTNADGTLDASDEKVTVNYNRTYNTDGTVQLFKYVENVKDANNAVISLTNPIDETTNKFGVLYNYDAHGNIVSMRTPGGNITTITYDVLRRPIRQTLPDNSTLEVEYNDALNYIITTDELGNKQKHSFDPLGRQTSQSALINDVWTTLTEYTYDAANRLASQSDYRTATDKVTTNYTYDTLDRMLSEYIPNEWGMTYTYTVPETNKTATSATPMYMDSAYSTTTEYKDPLGRTVKLTETNAAGTETHTTLYTHDYVGNVLTEQTPNHSTPNKFYTYDYMGNILTFTDALNNVTTYAFDLLGRNISVTNPRGIIATTEYDILGRPVKTTEKTGLVTKNFYDNDSNPIKTVGYPEYQTYTTVNTYDNRGRLLVTMQEDSDSSADNTDIVTTYTYDAAGNMLTSATGGKTTSYTYDSLGRNISKTDPLGKTESYTYDLMGNMTGKTDRKGTVFTYTYNPLGLMTNLSTSGLTYSYSYDKMGRKTGYGTGVCYTYDDFSNLISTNDGLSYSYDAEGNRTSLSYCAPYPTYFDNIDIDYTYDILGRLSNVKVDDVQYASYTYDCMSNPITKTTGAGITTYAYDDADNLMGITAVKGNKTLFSSSYTYDVSRHVTESHETVNGNYDDMYYYYDSFRHLSLEIAGPYPYFYEFDNCGNIIKKNDEELIYNEETGQDIYRQNNINYIYDNNNRLISEFENTTEDGVVISTSDTSYTYTYDDNGNMLTKSKVVVNEDNTTTTTLLERYTYDVLNRLTEMYNPEDNILYYFSYDSENRLIGKAQQWSNVQEYVDGVIYEEVYIWDGDDIAVVQHVSHENDYEDNDIGFLVRGHDLIAKACLYPENAERVTDDYFYIQNGHGDVVTMVDSEGEAVNTYTYDTYGNIISETEGTNNPFKYAGEHQTLPSSLIYLRNRIYSPALGRFLQEDPIRDGTNWYVYCNSNPINYWDPTGLSVSMSKADYDYMMDLNGEIFAEYAVNFETDKDVSKLEANDAVTITGMTYDDSADRANIMIPLMSSVVNAKRNFNFTFSDDSNSNYTLGDITVQKQGANAQTQAHFVHEYAHAYTDLHGYEGTMMLNIASVNSVGVGLYNIRQKYSEALAITVEEEFRKQMGYADRESDYGAELMIGVNRYGMWPAVAVGLSNGEFYFRDKVKAIHEVRRGYTIVDNIYKGR